MPPTCPPPRCSSTSRSRRRSSSTRTPSRKHRLLAAVRERPRGRSIPAALCEHALRHRLAAAEGDARFTAFSELVNNTPALRDYGQGMWLRHTSALARVIAEESGLPADDPACTALAHFALEAPRAAHGHDDPRQAVVRAFELLENRLAGARFCRRVRSAEAATGGAAGCAVGRSGVCLAVALHGRTRPVVAPADGCARLSCPAGRSPVKVANPLIRVALPPVAAGPALEVLGQPQRLVVVPGCGGGGLHKVRSWRKKRPHSRGRARGLIRHRTCPGQRMPGRCGAFGPYAECRLNGAPAFGVRGPTGRW